MNIPADKLWKYEAVFGSEYVKKAQEYPLTLEAFLVNAPDRKFWVNKDRTILSVAKTLATRHLYGELAPLTLKEAHEEFGIDVMEEASEKGYCKIKKQSA